MVSFSSRPVSSGIKPWVAKVFSGMGSGSSKTIFGGGFTGGGGGTAFLTGMKNGLGEGRSKGSATMKKYAILDYYLTKCFKIK